MSISEGSHLPDATLVKMGANGPEAVSVSALTAGRKVAIEQPPVAYSQHCQSERGPALTAPREALAARW